ncbi:MAG: PLP-dependent aminotransferase family protein [bacterium]|nr:PLP-dependent aminotransferase family protein [bacterium]
MMPAPLPTTKLTAHAMPELAHRMSLVKSSAVREILKVTERPEIISFAGGLPAPELFPVEAIAAAHTAVLSSDGAAALQYSTTEGYRPLREAIANRLNQQGSHTIADAILITNGSQQGIDLVAKVLLNPGDAVIVENPSYLAALQAMSAYEAEFVVVESDENGMVVEELENILLTHQPKMLYVVPNFNNPTGRTLSLERRKALVRLAQRHRFYILEDDPYGELRFRGERVPSLASLDTQGVVVSLGTFSKTFAPGLRIGWLSGPESFVRSLAVAKQSSDLHTSSLSQRVVEHLLRTFDYEGHIEKIRTSYGKRAQAMLDVLAETMPTGAKWSRPDGGMFIWVELPEDVDAEKLLAEAITQKVAFVPGNSFFANDQKRNFIRLNYSNQSETKIREGITRLAALLPNLSTSR